MNLRSDRGSAPIEAAIIVPAVGLVLALLIVVGRITITDQTVHAAAAEAARSATLARTAGQADNQAREAARATLTSQNTTCAATDIQVDTTGFSRPLGTPAQITVTVTCHLPLADVTLPGIGGTKTITATASSPLDPYRGR